MSSGDLELHGVKQPLRVSFHSMYAARPPDSSGQAAYMETNP